MDVSRSTRVPPVKVEDHLIGKNCQMCQEQKKKNLNRIDKIALPHNFLCLVMQLYLFQPTKEQELSPLKAGEGSEKRQRKKRAFKELLRNKQDKVEKEEPVQQGKHGNKIVCI
jgi:hypothetical protein